MPKPLILSLVSSWPHPASAGVLSGAVLSITSCALGLRLRSSVQASSGPTDVASGVCGNVRGIRSGLPLLSQNTKRPSPADAPRLIASSVNFQVPSEVTCANDPKLETLLAIKPLACSTVNGRPATVMVPERAAPGLG